MKITGRLWMANPCQQQAWTFLISAIGIIASGYPRCRRAFFWLILSALLSPAAIAAQQEAATSTAFETTTPETTPKTTPQTTPDADIWVPFRATYVAIMNGTTVDDNGTRILEYRGNGHFRYRAVAENILFKLEEISDFYVEDGQVYPQQYQSERSTPFQKRKKAIGYNWTNNTAHYQYRDRKGTLQLEGRVLDPMTSVFELSRHVKRGETTISYQEVGSRKIKTREFNVIGEERISLPYGELNTIKLRVLEDDDSETLIWLAPEKNYLAVKVKQNDDGEEYRLELKSYSPQQPVRLPLAKATPEPEPQAEKIPVISEPPPTAADIK